MRSQEDRDLQTVTIATSLAVFVATLVVGGLIDVIGDLTGRTSILLQLGTLALATMLGLAYLVRHRRA